MGLLAVLRHGLEIHVRCPLNIVVPLLNDRLSAWLGWTYLTKNVPPLRFCAEKASAGASLPGSILTGAIELELERPLFK